MTRLKTNDIREISSSLAEYDLQLQTATNKTLAGIAYHTWGADEAEWNSRINHFSIHVVPVTVGQGIITDFSETVCAILQFLGFDSRVTEQTDSSGIAEAFEKKADAIMMADDDRFVGINLHTREVVDNSAATGRAFAAALDLMATGIKDKSVLVIGCGPVGESGAKMLLHKGALVTLYDCRPEIALSLKKKFSHSFGPTRIQILDNLITQCQNYHYILEATPSKNTIPVELISDRLRIAAPGVPLGISKQNLDLLKDRLVHDKLELGVAAMAVNLILKKIPGD